MGRFIFFNQAYEYKNEHEEWALLYIWFQAANCLM